MKTITMTLFRKSYRKIGLHLLCLLASLSIGRKKTYAVWRSLACITKNLTLRKKYPYPSTTLYRKATCPYPPYASLGTSSIEVVWDSSTPTPQSKDTSSAALPQRLNFTMAPEKTMLVVECPHQDPASYFFPYFDSANSYLIFPPITGYRATRKQQLLLQLIEQYEENYDYIIWVNATTQQAIEESYLQVAKELDIPLPSSNTAAQVLPRIHDRLHEKHLLYLFDDAPDLKTIQPYLNHGHVLITSSNNNPIHWRTSRYDDPPLALDPFDTEEDVFSLAKEIGLDVTDKKSFSKLMQLFPSKNLLVITALFRMMVQCKYTAQALFDGLKESNDDFIAQLKVDLQTHSAHADLLLDIIDKIVEGLQHVADVNAYYEQKDYQKALVPSKKVLTLLMQINGNTLHPSIADAYHFIGLLYYHQGLYEKAIAFLQVYLNMHQTLYGDQKATGEVDPTYLLLATSYMHLDDRPNTDKFLGKLLALVDNKEATKKL